MCAINETHLFSVIMSPIRVQTIIKTPFTIGRDKAVNEVGSVKRMVSAFCIWFFKEFISIFESRARVSLCRLLEKQEYNFGWLGVPAWQQCVIS